MSSSSGTTRWWENYLVRYLMPSIAGVAILGWLFAHGGDGLRLLVFLPHAGERLDSASLILLFLYGNLFCYVASYPVLIFHVTRVCDFSDGKWPANLFTDGYLSTVVLTALAFFIRLVFHPDCAYVFSFVLATAFVILQFARLNRVFSPRYKMAKVAGLISPAFGYAYSLARRRGIPEQAKETTNAAERQQSDETDVTIDEFGDDDEVKRIRVDAWRREFMDTYRHMREHGNSAFIFLSELALAALVYCVIKKPGLSAPQQLGSIGALFAIWAVPAMFVHLLGQHLERRFSQYDRRIAASAAEHASGKTQ